MGNISRASIPGRDLIHVFEAKLHDFRRHIGRENFCGNPEIFALVERFLREKGLTYGGQ